VGWLCRGQRILESACCIICCSAWRVPRQPLTCSIIMRVLRGKSGAETLKKHQAHSLATHRGTQAKGRQPASPGKSQTPEKNVIDRISGSPEVKGCSWFEYTHGTSSTLVHMSCTLHLLPPPNEHFHFAARLNLITRATWPR
jgi:hypothetical protein